MNNPILVPSIDLGQSSPLEAMPTVPGKGQSVTPTKWTIYVTIGMYQN